MKKVLKELYTWLSLLFETFVSIFSVVLFSSFKTNRDFKKLRATRKENDICRILCNGPSLATYLEEQKHDAGDLLALNYFATTEYYQKLKPSNYIILDTIEIGRADISEEQKAIVLGLYNTIVNETQWPMTFFYPSSGIKDYADLLRKNNNITVTIYNTTPISGFQKLTHCLFRHSLGMPWPQNVSNAAVFCALNSGYKMIYLYGVDHSWMKSFDVHPETHRLYMNDGHFYEKENIRWFEKGAYLNWLKWTHRALLSHFELREYADSINAKIINKTASSFIEAYAFEEN